MRVVVVGLGVQGHKRRKFAGNDFVAAVDPVNEEADYRELVDVPLNAYDAALVCVPDEPKLALLTYLIAHGKHVLVEKPLWAETEAQTIQLQEQARDKGVVCYTAYNHRFEPHFVRMRDIIRSGELGDIYHCRMFYGNGTARLVRDSQWRDKGAGVLPDIGSHLLDTLNFWFGTNSDSFKVLFADCYENRSPDHVVIGSRESRPRIELEMTLLMWRNHFTCDVLAEKGSAHIQSLCKWGTATFTHRKRVLPSGQPPEENESLTQDDPTWALEYEHFVKLCTEEQVTDLSNDIWLNRTLRRLGEDALKGGRG